MRNFDKLLMICSKILIFLTLRRGVLTNIFRGAARRGGRRAPRKVAPRGLATLLETSFFNSKDVDFFNLQQVCFKQAWMSGLGIRQNIWSDSDLIRSDIGVFSAMFEYLI